MRKIGRLVQLDALLGIVISCYALYIEHKLEDDPLYVPSCDTHGASCSKVFRSEQAHILSYWGLVPKGHDLDLGLATCGIMLYSAYLLAISIPFRWFMREELFVLAASSGGVFSVYLLYVIKYQLNDFCIVCTSFHVCNFFMLVLAILEYRTPSVGVAMAKTKAKAKTT